MGNRESQAYPYGHEEYAFPGEQQPLNIGGPPRSRVPVEMQLLPEDDGLIGAAAVARPVGLIGAPPPPRVAEHKLERKRDKLNSMFGFVPSAIKLSAGSHNPRQWELHKPMREVREVASGELRTLDNILWMLFFGWWLSILWLAVGLVMAVTYVGLPYTPVCVAMARYFFWPFGKIIMQKPPTRIDNAFIQIIGHLVWLLIMGSIMLTLHGVLSFVCWMCVITIPMSKVQNQAIKLLVLTPLAITVHDGPSNSGSTVLLCVYRFVNVAYRKYNVGGFNVILANCLFFVFLSLFLGYILPLIDHHSEAPSWLLVIFCLISIIPLAYYIGVAIASISAQSSPAVGATLNAFFGSLVELILYFSALNSGLGTMVRGSVIGSLLQSLLLLPASAMIAGGVKYSEQKFNAESAGVSASLLLVSMIGVFTPTVFYVAFGRYHLGCSGCTTPGATTNGTQLLLDAIECSVCHDKQMDFASDPVFRDGALPLQYFCAAIMPLAYSIGLLFTLKTHAHLFVSDDAEQGGGHDSPDWSRAKCTAILLGATVLYALIAEMLVESIKPTLDLIGVSESFAGITIIAIVPSTSEFINAIKFAVLDDISLSVEIGMAYAVQVVLLQVPILIAFSGIWGAIYPDFVTPETQFNLIFDPFTVFACVISTLLVNYVTARGKTNYFDGSSLGLVYLLIVAAFYYFPEGSL